MTSTNSKTVSQRSSDASHANNETLYGHPLNDGRNQLADRRRLPSDRGDDFNDASASARKRQRARHYSQDDKPENTMTVMARTGLKIGDGPAVREYYANRFKVIQQTACKLIAKAWIKVIEPKKQSLHPYTSKEKGAPDWWPKAWGPSKDEMVRHKEPDHQYKPGKNSVSFLCLELRY